MTETPAEPLTAAEEAELRRRVAETGLCRVDDDNLCATHSEIAFGDGECEASPLQVLRLLATLDAARADEYDRGLADGYKQLLAEEAARATRPSDGEAYALDTERSVIPQSLVEQVIDATIGLSRPSGGLREALDPASRICRRYFSFTEMLCKRHGRDLARCEDWDAGFRAALEATEEGSGT